MEPKEAAKQFSDSELSIWERVMLSVSLLHAYNTEFTRQDDAKIPSDEDRELFMTAVDTIMKHSKDENSPLLIGELLRESGRFDEAVEVLRNLPDNDDFQNFVKPVLELAINRDPVPLLLVKDNKPLYQ